MGKESFTVYAKNTPTVEHIRDVRVGQPASFKHRIPLLRRRGRTRRKRRWWQWLSILAGHLVTFQGSLKTWQGWPQQIDSRHCENQLPRLRQTGDKTLPGYSKDCFLKCCSQRSFNCRRVKINKHCAESKIQDTQACGTQGGTRPAGRHWEQELRRTLLREKGRLKAALETIKQDSMDGFCGGRRGAGSTEKSCGPKWGFWWRQPAEATCGCLQLRYVAKRPFARTSRRVLDRFFLKQCHKIRASPHLSGTHNTSLFQLTCASDARTCSLNPEKLDEPYIATRAFQLFVPLQTDAQRRVQSSKIFSLPMCVLAPSQVVEQLHAPLKSSLVSWATSASS